MTPSTSGSFVSASLVGLVLSCFAAGAEATPEQRPDGRTFKVRQSLDVRYFGKDERQTLDVFQPEGATGCPVVLFVHGGAWMFGDKDLFGMYRGVGQYLAKHGVTAVLMNYRLSPIVKHPEHVKDVARAFAWTRRHIKEYAGNPDAIFLSGHSAGGHLAALLASDDSYLKDPALKLNAADRAAIRGVMAVSGVYRIPGSNEPTAMVAEVLNGVHGGAGPGPIPARFTGRRGQDFNLFKTVFGNDPKVRAQASPVNHVRPDNPLPPILLLWAERELPLLPEMAKDFARTLQAAGKTVEQKQIPGCHHNSILFNLSKANDPTALALLAFIDRHAYRPAPDHK